MNNTPDFAIHTGLGHARKRTLIQRMKRQKYLFLMMLPGTVIVFLFNYLTLAGWIMAFKNYRIGLSIWNAEWIGFEQFQAFLLQSSDYMYLLRNTLVMNVSMIVVNLIFSFCFAIFLNEIRSKWFSRLVQTISFFPYFISWVIIYAIMHALFAASSGAVNISLVQIGWLTEGLDLLGNEKFSWILIIGMMLWKTLGYNGVIFISAIASIEHDQYEAADIDGAGRFQKMWYITIPNLMPTLIVLLIMNSGWILNSNFELYYLFTNPTNWQTMEVLDMYIYKYGLQLTNYSYATAVGIMKSIVSIAIVMSVNYLSKKTVGKSIM
jgi:putative aldouronate transport system permease protein